MKQHQKQQKIIRLGTHGEDYGSWMSNPVFYMIGGLLTLSAVLAALSFSMFHIAALGVLFSVAAAALLALLWLLCYLFAVALLTALLVARDRVEDWAHRVHRRMEGK